MPKLLLTSLALGVLAAAVVANSAANAGRTVAEAGTLACVNDKWDETEPDKGHKVVDFGGRCVAVPTDPTAPQYAEDCTGKYEYMPDGSWKGVGTCTWLFKDGDKVYDTFEEGSHLKESTYTITGGTGKYQGAKGGGTYTQEMLTDALGGGRYKGEMLLP
jgi:hypothetical protein